MLSKAGSIRNLRPASGGNKNCFGGKFAVANAHLMWAGQAAPPRNQFGPGRGQKLFVDTFQPVQLFIFCCDQGRPVMSYITQRPAKPGRIFNISSNSCTIHQ